MALGYAPDARCPDCGKPADLDVLQLATRHAAELDGPVALLELIDV